MGAVSRLCFCMMGGRGGLFYIFLYIYGFFLNIILMYRIEK